MVTQRGQRKDNFHYTIRQRKEDCFLGPKNAGSTFCRINEATLKDQISRNVFTYVDDVVVASKKKSTHIMDLLETANMHEAQLKLNSEKCMFEVHKGKVLGCLVYEVSAIKKRCAKVDQKNYSTERIHINASRVKPSFLCSIKGL
jgi:hypothetical protein